MPNEVEHWSLTTLREKLVKIGAKVVRHGRYVTFQLAEVAISLPLFAENLQRTVGSRFRSIRNCGTVFGVWEEPSGKSRLNGPAPEGSIAAPR